MRNFCTLSDFNFLGKGLALYRSLMRTERAPFILDYLCLDRKSYDTIMDLRQTDKACQISPWLLMNLEDSHPDLKTARANRPYNEYCWTLASWFTLHLLRVSPNYESMTYLDSDLYFYSDSSPIFLEIGPKSVGIIRHRHNEVGHRDGAYNVGLVYFKNNEIGLNCLSWWSDAVLNKKHPELATCGDQKYLEDFIPRFGAENVCVADECFAHGAPWNYRLYCWDTQPIDGLVRWGNLSQCFTFNHFSRFSCDFTKDEINFTSGQYNDHTLGGQVFNIPQVRKLYIDYYNELKAIDTELKRAPSFLKGPPKVTFGMIVLNGDYVLKQSLESVYPFAHQILIAEGPVKFWQDKGITTSTDKTNYILDSFPDPQGKIKIVHGQWNEKDDQARAYMGLIDPATDYLWNLDSDEVFKSEDVEQLIKIAADNHYTSIGIRSCSFFGGFDKHISGFEEKCDQFLRVFKVWPGSTWRTHRPPTVVHTHPEAWQKKHLDSDSLWERWGIRMYHYSYVFPRQVKTKIDYYKSMVKALSGTDKVIDGYFEKVYLAWIRGTEEEKKGIERSFGGVHEWRPEFRGPAYTVPFGGLKDHPQSIIAAMPELRAEYDKQLKEYP